VRPILQYASVFCDTHDVGHMKLIEKIQRKVAKYVMRKQKKTERVSKLLLEMG
jgi:hypothetical protein